MKLSFSTLGCPEWSINDIVANAVRFGFSGVGIRGIGGEMDFARIPAFSPTERGLTRRKFEKAGLDVYILLSSARFTSPDAAEREKNLAHAREVIDLAAFMGSKLMRVFGGKIAEGVDRSQAHGWVAESLKRLGDYGAKKNVITVLEVHDDFTSTSLCRDIMQRVDHPWVRLLWDVHHPYRLSGEAIARSFENIRPWIWETHFKDSTPDPAQRLGYRYTFVGEGDVPNREALRLLKTNGYQGYLCLEWEKVWHPYLAAAGVAFPRYVTAMREYLAAL
jgi:sugar phosphate isomerase/epimerase